MCSEYYFISELFPSYLYLGSEKILMDMEEVEDEVVIVTTMKEGQIRVP